LSSPWFISPKLRPDAKLALFACGLAFIVILLGAYTRLTNAGLSCPDWPHCYGYLTAPTTPAQVHGAHLAFPGTPVDIKRAWTEMVHRYFAGTEAVLMLALIAALAFTPKIKAHHVKLMASALVTLLAAQILLGMLTVTEKLKPMIVTAHLLTGIAIMATLWWTYLQAYRIQPYFTHQPHRKIKPWIGAGLVVVAAQIALGGWVSTHYASLACVDFPYCNGKLLPALHLHQWNTDLITIHMMHRIGAFITAIVVGGLSLCLLQLKHYKILGGILLTLVCVQMSLGVLNIVWLRPVPIALLHLSVAILLLLTLIASLVKAQVESCE
jgi:cytochrome c oxidase assembly protein subunit 15